MIFRKVIVLAYFVAIANAQCSVCGEGSIVGNPDASFEFPGEPVVGCGVLEAAGNDGIISLELCASFPDLIGDACECTAVPLVSAAPSFGPTVVSPITPPTVNTFTPTALSVSAAPIFSPTVVSPITSSPVVNPVCSICGDGSTVGNPDAVFEFQGISNPCGGVQDAGNAGLITSDVCSLLPGITRVGCECSSRAPSTSTGPSLAPSTSPSVSARPSSLTVSPVTFAPVAPSAVPSASLSLDPTIIPSQLSSFVPSYVPTDAGPALIAIPTIGPTGNPTSAPSPVATASPTAPNSCPNVPPGGCSVCGDGLCVGNPDAIFSYPMQPIVPCGILQIAGYNGQVELTQCTFLPPLILDCDCGSNPPLLTSAPTLSPVLDTDAPVVPTAPVLDTDAPIVPTSPRPTRPPRTDAPSVAPVTPRPTRASRTDPPTSLPTMSITVAPFAPSAPYFAPVDGGKSGKKSKKSKKNGKKGKKSKKDGKKSSKKDGKKDSGYDVYYKQGGDPVFDQ